MGDGREAVLAVNREFYRAFEKKDMEAMAALWSQGIGSLCIHPGRDALKGWGAVGTAWEAIFKNTAYLEIETEIVSVEAGGDLAFVVLVENVRQVISGRQTRSQSMATNIFERMGQQWYMVHHHGSPLLR